MMKPTDTDSYIASLPADQAKALERLRKQIRAAAPKCTEWFGYGLPGFKLHGRTMLYMGATKKHCALYGMIPPVFDVELKGFERSKGAIRFQPDKPIPASVVKAIVKAKVAEMDAKWSGKGKN